VKSLSNPLHLPEGSVRAILAIVMVVAVAWNVGMGHQLTADQAILVTLVIRDYFESRRRKGAQE
jgi:uncharacterized membrane protein (DUF441 family)